MHHTKKAAIGAAVLASGILLLSVLKRRQSTKDGSRPANILREGLPSFADTPTNASTVSEIRLQEGEFLELLRTLIRRGEFTQNNPPAKIPQEELVADVVVHYLKPYTLPDGPLEVRKVTYKPGRSNVIIKYPAPGTTRVVSFVGSHLDVVPAERSEWKRDPFKLAVEGDRLYGRGVTDCLGHVAVFCNFFKQLAQLRPRLNATIAAVFIADEENGTGQAGIDVLMAAGELGFLRDGPLFWVDSANFGPTLATAGTATWKLKVHGQKGHSGMPHLAINPINLANETIKYLQRRFYEEIPMTDQEREYLFQVGSSLKPTKFSTEAGTSINQIPQTVIVEGDVRVTPFRSVAEVQAKVASILGELTADLGRLSTVGYETFELSSGAKGRLEWEWGAHTIKGVAVDRASPGYQALTAAIKTARGEAKPFSLTGSLPIIADLKEAGFDVQITGFGRMDAYHALDEYGQLSEFAQGTVVVAEVVGLLTKDTR